MSVKPGDNIPSQKLVIMDKVKGPQPFSLDEFCKEKKIVLFGVPGAFTPTCARNHLPGYIEKAQAIKDKGVAEILCFATNDIFTMTAWEEMSGAIGEIVFLSDSKAKFSKLLGTDFPDSFGTSIKTKRCSILITNGVIEQFFVESEDGVVDVSSADHMLTCL